MAKKPKSKKSDQNKGEDEAKEKLSEVDKEWYQIQIKALEEKLQSRSNKLNQLEVSNIEYQEKYEQLREDKADVVAYLKRTLQQRLDQTTELRARLDGLQQVHVAEGEKYRGQLAQKEQEFARTKEQLVSENMVLSKKLDALEEFRIQREQLMARFEGQEKRQDELIKEYERKLEQQEKKHILEEDRLKRGMIDKLESVASDFRKASHAQMAATTQRTIRENVSVSSQVTLLAEKVAQLTEENDKLTAKNESQRRRIETLEVEQKELIKGNAYKLRLIEDISFRNSRHQEEMKQLDQVYNMRRTYEEKINMQKSEIEDLSQELGMSARAVKEKEKAYSDIKLKMTGMVNNKSVVNTCLEDASEAIKAALAFQSDIEDSELTSQRQGILNHLLVMLNTAVNEGEQKKKDGYLHGSLGLVPDGQQ